MSETVKTPSYRYYYQSGDRPLEGYEIKRAIGHGGFGEVYYAVSDAGKEVALKLILRNLEIERRGVRHCMNLKCPNLVTIYDLKVNDAGECWVVMEYISGPNLGAILERNPEGLPPDEVHFWLEGVARGVEYLHRHGIVHRDLKPANIFLEDHFVKIGDYGLAKAINKDNAAVHSDRIGTCHYMAPEISHGRYDKAVDIYAMGIILHEMITGKVPFQGESVGEILMRHLMDQPRLESIGEPHRSIIARALAKAPELRQKSPLQLLPSANAGASAPEIVILPPNYPDPNPIRDVRPDRAATPAPSSPAVDRDAPTLLQPAEPWNVQGAEPANDGITFLPPEPPGRFAWNPIRARVGQLPGGDLRRGVAEWSGSLALAALLCALIAVVALVPSGTDPTRSPGGLALLFLGPLALSWALISRDRILGWLERAGTKPSRKLRAGSALAAGLGAGAIVFAVMTWTGAELPPEWFDRRSPNESGVPPLELGTVLATFAALGLGASLWNLAGRERRRLRIPRSDPKISSIPRIESNRPANVDNIRAPRANSSPKPISNRTVRKAAVPTDPNRAEPRVTRHES